MKEKKEETIEFTGKPARCVFNSESFKVYAVDVDADKYPDVKRNSYGNVSIIGELPSLDLHSEYTITGCMQLGKYGQCYKVTNIKRETPVSSYDMYVFLSEILTERQADALWESYPDIVERVKNNDLADIDLKKIKGVGETTFEKIKSKIIENFCLVELVSEFGGYLTLPIIRRLYNKYSSIEVLKEKLRTNPYKCLCGISGIGFKTADDILLKIEKASLKNTKDGKEPLLQFKSDLKTSPERCLSAIIYILEQNENDGHTKMNLADARRQCMDIVPACANHFVECVKSDEIYYSKDKMEIALRKTYDIECFIAKKIIESLSSEDTDVWEVDIEKYRKVGELSLSDEQLSVLTNVCRYHVSILNGFAGSGKSFSTQALIQMLRDNLKTFRLFSPTGKAAKVLTDFTGVKVSTIHRGLLYSPSMGWGYNKDNKLDVDVVIVDEVSMVDVFLMYRLFDALDLTKTKVLFIGDNAQLPSVSCGNLFHDFMHSGVIPTATLTKIFRYGEGGLMSVATDTRNCEPYLNSNHKSRATIFGKNEDYTFVDMKSEDIPEAVAPAYKKLLTKGYTVEDIQVLTSKNVGSCGTIVLNNKIQVIANPNYGKGESMKCGDTQYYEGDIVLQKVNNYDAEIDPDYADTSNEPDNHEDYGFIKTATTAFVANGETGIIKRVTDKYMTIAFGDICVRYTKSDLNMIGLGYAMTIHKSQGSSIKIVILCTPKDHSFMLNSNLLYVGLTRMKEKLYHLGSYGTINSSVKKKANLTRHTFMQDMLKSNAHSNSK